MCWTDRECVVGTYMRVEPEQFHSRGCAENREEIGLGAKATHPVPRDWVEKPHESAQPSGVRVELPIGAHTRPHLLWDGGGCVIAFVCYRWKIPDQGVCLAALPQ